NWTMQLSPFGTQAFELPMTGRSTSASATPAASASATPAASATEKPAAAWLEQLSTAQRKCAEAVADMLKRHQETLDEEYRAGIRAIDDAFRVGEAKNPEQFH